MNDFIENFKKQFEDENIVVKPNTVFRDLDGWDSLTSLMVVAMFDEIYNVSINSDHLQSATTIKDLYNFIKCN